MVLVFVQFASFLGKGWVVMAAISFSQMHQLFEFVNQTLVPERFHEFFLSLFPGAWQYEA